MASSSGPGAATSGPAIIIAFLTVKFDVGLSDWK